MVRSMFDREWRITRKSTRNGSSSFYKRALSLLDSTLFEKRNLPPEFLRRAGERRPQIVHDPPPPPALPPLRREREKIPNTSGAGLIHEQWWRAQIGKRTPLASKVRQKRASLAGNGVDPCDSKVTLSACQRFHQRGEARDRTGGNN